jgi:hypothetical protein
VFDWEVVYGRRDISRKEKRVLVKKWVVGLISKIPEHMLLWEAGS